MAWAQTETQIQWGGADKKSVAAGGSETSDSVTLKTDTAHAFIRFKADNSDTPASGDDVDFNIQVVEDIDSDTTDDVDNIGDFLANLDTNDQDPAVRTYPLFKAIQGKTIQIQAENNAGSNDITVSAYLYEERWS